MDQRITIGYLSWLRHDVLVNTLTSHQENGLYDIIPLQNRIIFFQEISDMDREISNRFGCSYIGANTNIGIMEGFVKLVNKCQTEYFLFSENDWELIHAADYVKKMINDCINILQNNEADIIKLRDRHNPGMPLYSKPKNSEQWFASPNLVHFPYKLESLNWVSDPMIIYGNRLTEYNGNFRWYITSIRDQLWSNNIFMAKTSYLKKVIVPLLELYQKIFGIEDNYSGLETVLISYDSYRNHNKDFDRLINQYEQTKIAGGEGMFKHNDLRKY